VDLGLALTLAAVAWTAPLLAAALAVMWLVAAYGVSRPTRWLTVLTWALPFHILGMAILFGGLGIPARVVRVIAGWKELVVVLLLLATVVRAAAGRGPRVAVSAVDVAVAGLGLLAAAYLIGATPLLGADIPVVAQLYGFRDTVFFTALYFVGRGTPGVNDGDAALKRLFAVGVITSVVAVAEWLFVTPQMLVVMGAASYFNDFLGVAAMTTGNEFGLPDNYWTMMGGRFVQRAGSVYLSSQGFATPFLLIMPAATALLLRRDAPPAPLSWRVGYALLWTALLLSITRMTLLVCLVQVLLLGALYRRWGVLATAATVSVAAVIAGMIASPALASLVWETLTWQSGSSVSHVKDWAAGARAVWEQPLGAGLGTTDQTAVRFGVTPLTADNLYLKYAVELGIAGLIAYVAVVGGAARAALRLFRGGVAESDRALGACMLAATLGVTINGMTTALYNHMVLSYLLFWLLGTTVTLAQGSYRYTPRGSDPARRTPSGL
jgi:hypothetical protein